MLRERLDVAGRDHRVTFGEARRLWPLSQPAAPFEIHDLLVSVVLCFLVWQHTCCCREPVENAHDHRSVARGQFCSSLANILRSLPDLLLL